MKSMGRAVSLLLFTAAFLLVLPGRAHSAEKSSSGPSTLSYPLDSPARWDQLFDKHDAAALAGEYSESVVSMPFDAPDMNGRKALQADFEKFFAENDNARHETRVVQLLSGYQWVVERADYTLTYTPKASGKPVVENGRHVVCRKWEAGKWLIAWEIWNRVQPGK